MGWRTRRSVSTKRAAPAAAREATSARICGATGCADLSADAVDEARTARATKEFEGGEGLNVEAQVTVFEDDDVPSTLVDLLDDDETLQCLSDTIQQEAEASDDELTITSVEVGEAPAVPDDLGEQRGSARMSLTIEHSSGQTFDFQADIYAVRVDRATVTLTVTQLAGQGLAEGDVDAALEAMTTRLEDGD